MVSASYAAVQIFGSPRNKSVLLVEAGEMAEMAVEHLVQQLSALTKNFRNSSLIPMIRHQKNKSLVRLICIVKKILDCYGSSLMKSEFRRIIAPMLLFVAIIGLAMSLSEDILCAGELPGAHEAVSSFLTENSGAIHDSDCLCAPAPSHAQDDDHVCFGGCNGPCHAPLASTPVIFTYSPLLIARHPAEITRHIPEVYLSLFVPPDTTIL